LDYLLSYTVLFFPTTDPANAARAASKVLETTNRVGKSNLKLNIVTATNIMAPDMMPAENRLLIV